LGHRLEHRPAELSGGERQRVAVARALVFEPKLILMDEPLGALDKQLREQMQYEIKHIHETLEVTVVYVTHDQSEALTMSNRIAVFNDGIIQQLAPPEELYELPENAFVAQFIGENNRLVGTVTDFTGKNCTVQVEDGSNIEALVVNVRNTGEQSTLSLRPERVFVRPEPGSCPNIFDATVEELIYLGDHVRTRVSLLGHDDFVIKVPNSAGHQHLKTGETVKVGWQAEDCRALDYL
jgi:putative spermidine/putrescine transport system ATP-binding protein